MTMSVAVRRSGSSSGAAASTTKTMPAAENSRTIRYRLGNFLPLSALLFALGIVHPSTSSVVDAAHHSKLRGATIEPEHSHKSKRFESPEKSGDTAYSAAELRQQRSMLEEAAGPPWKIVGVPMSQREDLTSSSALEFTDSGYQRMAKEPISGRAPDESRTGSKNDRFVNSAGRLSQLREQRLLETLSASDQSGQTSRESSQQDVSLHSIDDLVGSDFALPLSTTDEHVLDLSREFGSSQLPAATGKSTPSQDTFPQQRRLDLEETSDATENPLRFPVEFSDDWVYYPAAELADSNEEWVAEEETNEMGEVLPGQILKESGLSDERVRSAARLTYMQQQELIMESAESVTDKATIDRQEEGLYDDWVYFSADELADLREEWLENEEGTEDGKNAATQQTDESRESNLRLRSKAEVVHPQEQEERSSEPEASSIDDRIQAMDSSQRLGTDRAYLADDSAESWFTTPRVMDKDEIFPEQLEQQVIAKLSDLLPGGGGVAQPEQRVVKDGEGNNRENIGGLLDVVGLGGAIPAQSAISSSLITGEEDGDSDVLAGNPSALSDDWTFSAAKLVSVPAVSDPDKDMGEKKQNKAHKYGSGSKLVEDWTKTFAAAVADSPSVYLPWVSEEQIQGLEGATPESHYNSAFPEVDVTARHNYWDIPATDLVQDDEPNTREKLGPLLDQPRLQATGVNSMGPPVLLRQQRPATLSVLPWVPFSEGDDRDADRQPRKFEKQAKYGGLIDSSGQTVYLQQQRRSLGEDKITWAISDTSRPPNVARTTNDAPQRTLTVNNGGRTSDEKKTQPSKSATDPTNQQTGPPGKPTSHREGSRLLAEPGKILQPPIGEEKGLDRSQPGEIDDAAGESTPSAPVYEQTNKVQDEGPSHQPQGELDQSDGSGSVVGPAPSVNSIASEGEEGQPGQHIGRDPLVPPDQLVQSLVGESGGPDGPAALLPSGQFPQNAAAQQQEEDKEEEEEEEEEEEATGELRMPLSSPTTTKLPVPVTMRSPCRQVLEWMPPRVTPAVVLQVVSKDFIPVEENFILFMEKHSTFTRHNLFLLCLDSETDSEFDRLGVQCVHVKGVQGHNMIWRLRVKALSCLVGGPHDVIMSDSDALWLKDPIEDLKVHGIDQNDIIAQRGSFPVGLGKRWGATLCMGFVVFKGGTRGVHHFVKLFERLVREHGDDQVAINEATLKLGIAWDHKGDMRYEESTSTGRGIVHRIPGNFTVALLPHDRYTRKCDVTPLSNETVVAHCLTTKSAKDKLLWMKGLNLWLVDQQLLLPLPPPAAGVTPPDFVEASAAAGERVEVAVAGTAGAAR